MIQGRTLEPLWNEGQSSVFCLSLLSHKSQLSLESLGCPKWDSEKRKGMMNEARCDEVSTETEKVESAVP